MPFSKVIMLKRAEIPCKTIVALKASNKYLQNKVILQGLRE